MMGMRAGKAIRLGMAVALLAAAPALAQNYPTYEVVSRDDNGLELRFHGVPLKAVHADDSQNALAIDFQQPVDGAVFDRLAGDQPGWIAMAYANFDNGVIRATRPVTFLTRQESDGFSLKIVPRGAVPTPPPMQAPPPVALRGPAPENQYAQYAPPPAYGPPPPPAYGAPAAAAFRRSDTFSGARTYYGLQLAANRADYPTQRAFDDADAVADSDLHFGTEYKHWANGDRVITSHVGGRLALGGGISLIGSLYDNDVASSRTLTTAGTAAPIARNVLTGDGGISLALWDGGEARFLATGGNGKVGGLIETLSTSPDGYWLAKIAYHQPYTDTPVAVGNHAVKDEAVLGVAQRLSYGFWGSLNGHYDRFGLTGLNGAVSTAGWNGNLRWTYDLGGIMAGLSYDGHGDYITDSTALGLSALGIHNMEVHAGSLSLSGSLWDGLWLDIFGGYAGDRYANQGAFEGASLRYTFAPGLDMEVGVRHSQVSFTQGELGEETAAGLRLTMGFGSPGQVFGD
jgi:hypothetical protein